jgi:hypothetical protein
MTLAYTLTSFIETLGFTKCLYKCHQTVGGTLCEWHGAAWNLGCLFASSGGLLQAHNSPFYVKHVCPETCATLRAPVQTGWCPLLTLAHPLGALSLSRDPKALTWLSVGTADFLSFLLCHFEICYYAGEGVWSLHISLSSLGRQPKTSLVSCL